MQVSLPVVKLVDPCKRSTTYLKGFKLLALICFPKLGRPMSRRPMSCLIYSVSSETQFIILLISTCSWVKKMLHVCIIHQKLDIKWTRKCRASSTTHRIFFHTLLNRCLGGFIYRIRAFILSRVYILHAHLLFFVLFCCFYFQRSNFLASVFTNEDIINKKQIISAGQPIVLVCQQVR